MSTHSITHTRSNATVPQTPAINTHSTNARVLEVIRNKMPITTLFTPELKIDLGVFIQDQMLIHELAKLIASMNKDDSIAEQFNKSELLTRIKALFKQDPDPFLALLFEACADVLNEKPSSSSLKPAIEGRIPRVTTIMGK